MYSPESDSEDELPPGWEERATLQGEVYYANHPEGRTQWAHPRTGKRKRVADSLPFGWERRILEDNKVLYIDHTDGRTTFTDPRLAFAKEDNAPSDSFRQRFDGSTGALQVLHGHNLSGKTAVITGANSGIGLATARALALHGCHVVFACRSEERANAAINSLKAERATVQCSFMHLDLESLNSVGQFARRLVIQHPAIDYLVLNAGVFGKSYACTEDGLESTMQVNYISNFYLVKLVLKSLIAVQECRIVVLSSESHRFSPVDLDSLDLKTFQPNVSHFSSINQYNTSKLYCLLFARALHLKYAPLGVKCMAVHPGNLVNTNLKKSWWFYWILFSMLRPFTKSPDQAAASVVFALCSPDLETVQGFTYINNCFPTRPCPRVEQSQFTDKLWQLSADFLQSKNL